MLQRVPKILAEAKYQTYKDTSFQVTDSPATLDINTDLGKNATQVFVWNDGSKEFSLEMSADGSTWSDLHTMRPLEKLELRDVIVDSIRITWSGDTGYRVLAL